jgi:hypothetical protein
MSKILVALRLEKETIEKIKNIAPEGNVSMWIRLLITEKLNEYNKKECVNKNEVHI